MPHFSASTIVLIIIAALLLFGPQRLPELGRAVGRTFRELKSGAKEIVGGDEEPQASSQSRKEIRSDETGR
ncbi:twin-arginine translocase TatA/TatE family subunit [Cohnella silvisoli]|uniref:Twin-arginine translocase TatA/TatE family subunit n=1 Tax=Cohnella silvisoli TaxID=2873699 RepID=A0ABV1KRB5_9BACL|nr:twin-arginine translocase TatA/TatE family subunit [Cohnella silvisoli]MCD9021678.1 twin-arginine translocase TatA/TatE family subunit [Cohnella silvisoli]